MSTLDWFQPLEDCSTLDELRLHWPHLLEKEKLFAGNEDPRYRDAILAFLASARLPANLKMAAMLLFVPTWNLDLRLAYGALAEELEAHAVPWPTSCPEIEPFAILRLQVPVQDPWLEAFLNGRLAGLHETFPHDGTRREAWSQAFWDKVLTMYARWADRDGMMCAHAHGARVDHDDYAAIRAAAEGTQADGLRGAYYTAGRTHEHYCQSVNLLLTLDQDGTGSLSAAMQAAAAANNIAMLAHVLAKGADLATHGNQALAAASGNFAQDALEWLLSQSANFHADLDTALLAAVCTLNVDAAQTLLDAGANVHAQEELPLCTAFLSQPTDLYAGEEEFVEQRADMITLLLQRGAILLHPDVQAMIEEAPLVGKIMTILLTRNELDETIYAQVLEAVPRD